MDWIQSKRNGHCYLIEMNPRPTTELQLTARTGVDFAEGVRHIFRGGPKPVQRPAAAPNGTWRMFPQELYRCCEERDFTGLAAWLFDIARGRSDIPWDDHSLVVGMLKKFGRHYQNTRRQPKVAG